MKIAYLLGVLRRGGTETLRLNVFRNAQKADYQFVGIHRKDGEYKEAFYSSGQKMYKLAPRFIFDVAYFLKLRKIFKTEKIDIAHAQLSIDALYAKFASIFPKTKVILTTHGYDNFNKKNYLLSFILKYTDKNFFVSDFQREYYTKKYRLNPRKLQTVYNGISFDKIDGCKETTHLFSDNYKGLLIGSVGNFAYTRTQIVICRALRLLAEKNVDFRFVFAGLRLDNQAHLYDECVDFCKENNLLNTKVFFLGGRDDVPNILKQLDVFVYSSAHDTFGIAVIEAIACGLPVFVNDWGVMKEVSDNGKFAILYRTKDENDLLEKFLLFLKNESFYKEEAKKNAVEIRKKFPVEQHIRELEKEYKKLLTVNCN
ncbi:MAG: glycosyltransferase family 4 protein [Prevotellaceae bacterium]|jgi:glycosyltransferase involved in cell wall biosynthesis|nr:glycosyltransferase family 4 protein [Prevotellaceae bacterium]